MNAYLWAGLALLVAQVPLFVVLVRSATVDRLVALEAASVNACLALLVLSEGFQRTFYADAAVMLAFLSIAGGFAFARFLERWL